MFRIYIYPSSPISLTWTFRRSLTWTCMLLEILEAVAGRNNNAIMDTRLLYLEKKIITFRLKSNLIKAGYILY